LSYARPFPKELTHPEGYIAPLGRLVQAYLPIGHHVEVSTLSGRGNRCIPYPDHYSPAFAFSTILYPLRHRPALRPGLSRVATRRHVGLTLFRTRSRSQEGSAFLPVV